MNISLIGRQIWFNMGSTWAQMKRTGAFCWLG
nr:MAG TPA: hypothetical protein [Caudoviricetes sp.]